MVRIISKRYIDLLSKSVSVFIILSFISCHSSRVKRSASYLNVPPVIDGKMDSIWNKVPDVRLHNYNQGAKYVRDSNDLSADYRIAWDTSRLYFLIHVIDDKKFDVRKFKYVMDIPQSYDCDCVELFFDMKDRKINRPGTFHVNDGDSRYSFVYDGLGITGNFKSKKGIVFAQSDTRNGYMFEIAIPFETLSAIHPVPGYTFGFEVSVDDNDNSPGLPYYNFDHRSVLSWSQKHGTDAWTNTGVYGDITLSK